MPRVFISYRRADSSSLATLIAISLKQHNIDAFVDTRSIDGGGLFPDRLRRAIETADLFLCLLGATTLDSEWVRKEIEYAHNLNKILIPVFQERYVAPDPVPDEHVEALLQSDGVHMLDVRNVYVDEAIAQIAKMVRGSMPPVPATVKTEESARLALVRLGVILFLLIAGGLVIWNIIAQQQLNQIAATGSPTSTLSPTPDLVTNAPTITDQPASTPEPKHTTTPSATPRPTLTSTPAPTLTPALTVDQALVLARAGVTRNADWIPYVATFDGVEMALVPVGCFEMGKTVAGGRQCFDEPFWIDRYEVTNAQYKRCVDTGECEPPHDIAYYDDPLYADHPVVYIDWFQASQYAAWRNGLLPTESEWEYAARGPDGLEYPWGNDFDGTRLNFCDTSCSYDWRDNGFGDGYARTAPVGSYPTGGSWLGALDLSGNIWEWMSSRYEDYPYLPGDGREDQDGIDIYRVLRGGSWYDNQGLARSAYRGSNDPKFRRGGSVGFRVVRPIS